MFRYTSSVGLAALTMVLFAWRRISRSVVNLSFSVTIKSVSIGLLSFSCLVTLLKTRPCNNSNGDDEGDGEGENMEERG